MHRQHRLTPVQEHPPVRSFACLECRPLFGKPALQFLAGCHWEIVNKNAYHINIFAYSRALSDVPAEPSPELATGVSALYRLLRSIVARINARIVKRALDWNPVGRINSALVGCRRTRWKSRYHVYPPVLLSRNDTHFRCHLGKILVLTEHQCHVVRILMRQPNHIDGDTNIDALSLRRLGTNADRRSED
jgi:hypothetical protein